MSEWRRNKIRTNNFPKALQAGALVEARQRDGTVFSGIVGEHEWLKPEHFNTSDHSDGDVMAFRILPSEPAAEPAKPDYSKGFPVGTTAKDIGAKVGDEFVVVSGECHCAEIGSIVKLAHDDGSVNPYFYNSTGNKDCISWHKLAPIPQKTAIELQAEEVGIPEPAQHVAGEWIEWKGGDCPVPKGTLVDVRYRNGHEEIGIPAGEHSGSSYRMNAIDWADNGFSADITAYRLHRPQEWPEDRIDVIGQNGNTGEHYTDAQQAAKADKLIDDAAQKAA